MEDIPMKLNVKRCIPVIFAMGIAGSLWAQGNRPDTGRGQARIEREVRHELVMLPFYGVFDNFSYKVDGGTVTLLGQGSPPCPKSVSGKRAKRISGAGND